MVFEHDKDILRSMRLIWRDSYILKQDDRYLITVPTAKPMDICHNCEVVGSMKKGFISSAIVMRCNSGGLPSLILEYIPMDGAGLSVVLYCVPW